MEYKDIRENLEEMMNDNYKDFIKALVSIEKGV
ncbi:MAG: DNA-binding protein, partial [Anaerococcus sp.]|nr:DNA-binding protein [Anaerococcus sp.]